MMHDTTDRILVALFCLCRDTRPVDASTLGHATGLSPTQAAEALLALERAGWVDASRARLTMLGLARATQLSARAGHGHGGGGLRLAAVSSPPQLVQRARIKPPVAARAVARRQSDSMNDVQQPLLQHVAGASVGQ
jgi:hypothetical protein